MRWPEEAIALLETGEVDAISLDHDLGDDTRTGYDVLAWMEDAVATRGFVPSAIAIHSANAGARPRMALAVESRSRVRLLVRRPHVVVGEVRVDLRRRDVRVPEEGLDAAQVGATLERVSSRGAPRRGPRMGHPLQE